MNTADITSNKHGGNAESVAANARNANHRTDQRQQVLEAIKDAPDGLTMKELAAEWDVQLNTISGRASELKALGLVEKVGSRNGSAVLAPTGKVFAIGGLTKPSQLYYVGEQPGCTLPHPKASAAPLSPSQAEAELASLSTLYETSSLTSERFDRGIKRVWDSFDEWLESRPWHQSNQEAR